MKETLFTILLYLTGDIPSAELVRPDAYAIKRFEEVIEQSQKQAEEAPEERLIALRAQLVIAERNMADLKKGNPGSEAAKPQALRAAQARIDYYQKDIDRFEAKILKEKRNPKKKSRP